MYVLHHLNVSGPVVIASQAYSHVARACYGISVALLLAAAFRMWSRNCFQQGVTRENDVHRYWQRPPRKASKEQAIQMILA